MPPRESRHETETDAAPLPYRKPEPGEADARVTCQELALVVALSVGQTYLFVVGASLVKEWFGI